MAAGSKSPEKLDELAARIRTHAKQVADEGQRKRIERLATMTPVETEVLTAALRDLRKALE